MSASFDGEWTVLGNHRVLEVPALIAIALYALIGWGGGGAGRDDLTA